MNEDIKILEELISEYKNNVWNEYPYKFNEEIIQAIENLIQRNKELEEENKKITDEYLIQRNLINSDFLSKYIPKSKIKEKIKEYEDSYMISDITDNDMKENYKLVIIVLQELLEE